jgi:hypothetical protein
VILTVPHTPATEGFFERSDSAREADGVLYQHWPRNDDQVERLGHGAGGGPDRRCGAGCLRTGAAAERPSTVGAAERFTHATYGRARPYLNDRRF